MSLLKPKPVRGIQFNADRNGFMCALSRRESSSNLLLPHNHKDNLKSQIVINQIGYVGYFQFGEDALIDCGYYNPRKQNSDKSRKNNWTGSWTGKNNIRSLQNFRSSPEVQVKAFQEWVNILCNRIRNLNINEFYGKIINGVEITESGCIAGSHLKGAGHVLNFITSNGKINGTDGNNVGVGEYIGLLALYDLETCCNRKIYITVKDNNSPVAGIAVQVESEYKAGKYYSKVGKIKNTYTTNEDGKVPVIVRHPGAVIKVTVNGKSQTIIQEASKRQSYTIDITGSIKTTGTLSKPDTPTPRPVPDKSPQDVRNEQSSKPQAPPASSSTETKEVTFNLTIVEGDTQKPITNLRYYLIYKSKPKEHRTDNQGIESNITAEVGQDIEVCVAGNGKLQAVAHFKVSSSHQGKTIRVLLPVEAFNIEIKDHNKQPVKNRKFIIFYRGREIVKQTNSQGLIGVKMLVGFVYKFGLTAGKPLATLRCIKGAQTQTININEAAKNKTQGVSRPTKPPSPPPKPENNPPPTKPTVTKPKPSPVTEESHTEKNGRPVTSVITDKAASDTTRYHIYHDGNIKRQNANATGYAEFIYYDENGGKHNLGKSAYIVGNKYELYKVGKKTKSRMISGNTYLINYGKHSSYRKGNTGYKWRIVSNEQRYYLSGLSLACVLGAMCRIGYGEYHGSGFSPSNGSSGNKSVSHINGINGDFRYLANNNKHMTDKTHTTSDYFDWNANVELVNTLYDFGYKHFLSQPVKIKKGKMLPHSSPAVDHHHHVHLQGFKPKVTDI